MEFEDKQGGGMDDHRQLECFFNLLAGKNIIAVKNKQKKSNLFFLVVVSGFGPRSLGRGV